MVNSDKVDDWSWVDALQMVMLVFAKSGVLEKDRSEGASPYFEKMYQIDMHSKTRHGGNGLYNPKDGL